VLSACKLKVPMAHVEAGLRSGNRDMPEEHNRIVADHVSDLLFCPTPSAVENLDREGLSHRAHFVGDTMYEATLGFRDRATQRSDVLERLGMNRREYFLATIHRPYNTDDPSVLAGILDALGTLPFPVVLPLHPRTKAKVADYGLEVDSSVRVIEPIGFLDMIRLEDGAKSILTDSGGVQKEAFFLGVPCVTLRPETEWSETVELGWNKVVGGDPDRIRAAVEDFELIPETTTSPFGNGDASDRIVHLLRELRL